ncbi:hypothetical protein BJY52DRAFT_66733 [Lactarius psammicola]|nr:hypothetical protein BJY52DRAFT_66733 [Lactarius psammicola]
MASRGASYIDVPSNRDTDAQQGKNYGDSSGRLWTMYLTEAEKEDENITENWKVEADRILMFTGLFSATVAAFIIESYKNLSPNSGDTTNALLTQISQQLVNISDGTLLTSVAAQSSQPFKPTASAVRVNVLWFLSLVISLNCALSATLMQQWARRYQELTQRQSTPHIDERVRAFIYDGLRKFGALARVVTPITTLLHISVFLFLAGLVEFLVPIYTTVAYTTLGCIGLFALPYATLTVLPNIYLNCPYGTPMSEITWRLSRVFVLGIFLTIRGIEGLFHRYLLTLWHRTHRQVAGPLGPIRWRETLDNQVMMGRRWLSDGLRKSVELSATGAPPTVDAYALEWTLTALHRNEEIEDFVASIPGFFDSRAVPDPTSAILPLMSGKPKHDSDPILGSRVYDLLNTCVPGTSPLQEELRRNRLRICLKTLWYFAREYNLSRNATPLPSYVRTTFANPEMTRRIQSEEDPAARLMGCSFSALVVKKLTQDIGSRTIRNSPLEVEAELLCLAAILGKTSAEVATLLSQPGAIGLANIVSLTSSETYTLVEERVPSEVLDIFLKTLDILFAGDLWGSPGAELPPDLVAVFDERSPLGQRLRAPDLRVDRLREILEGLSAARDEPEVTTLAMPEPEPGLG